MLVSDMLLLETTFWLNLRSRTIDFELAYRGAHTARASIAMVQVHRG